MIPRLRIINFSFSVSSSTQMCCNFSHVKEKKSISTYHPVSLLIFLVNLLMSCLNSLSNLHLPFSLEPVKQPGSSSSSPHWNPCLTVVYTLALLNPMVISQFSWKFSLWSICHLFISSSKHFFPPDFQVSGFSLLHIGYSVSFFAHFSLSPQTKQWGLVLSLLFYNLVVQSQPVTVLWECPQVVVM